MEPKNEENIDAPKQPPKQAPKSLETDKSDNSFWDNYKYIIIIGLFCIIGYLVYSYFYTESTLLTNTFGSSNSYKPTEPFFSPETPSIPNYVQQTKKTASL